MDRKTLLSLTLEKNFSTDLYHKIINLKKRDQYPRVSSADGEADKIIERLYKMDAWMLTIFEKNYPDRLKNLEMPPLILFGRGDKGVLKQDSFAIVGTRKSTEYGKKYARYFSRELANAGLVITSGGARGVDTEVHRGAIDAKGKTICVLGSGLDYVYPPENRSLFRKVVERGGAVITEYPPGKKPMKFHFPFRNRIIAGLSKGILVIEARERSGTFSTVNWALKLGKEVYALPGSIDSRNSWGTNFLIKEGAHLVMSPRDILEDLGISALPRIEKIKLNEEESRIMEFLDKESRTIDDIAETLKWPIPKILNVLLNMEIRGIVEQTPGKRYRKKL